MCKGYELIPCTWNQCYGLRVQAVTDSEVFTVAAQASKRRFLVTLPTAPVSFHQQ